MPNNPEAEQKSVVFRIGAEGNPEKPIAATLYAFDAQGELISSAPVRDGVAQLDVKPFRLRRARLFVAPDLPESRGEKPSIRALEKLKAYEPSWRFERGRNQYELLPIPEIHWPFWLWCSCRVRGRVIKVETVGGVTSEKPVCHARVHICEVDRIPWIIARLPDVAIRRLRDELILELQRPIPVDPNPPDPVIPRAARVFGKLDARLDAVALNPQPLPPKVRAEVSLPLELHAALSSGSTRLMRDALIRHVDLIRLYWCRWSWLDHFYFYNCDELAVIETDEQGRFDTTIWYLCNDHPDLYFWVEYAVDGVWETVYKPNMRCNTYWNYECGSEVTLRLRDPRVHGCGETREILGKTVVVRTIGERASMGEIYRGSPDPAVNAKEGQRKEGWHHATKPSPFGATLDPRVDFGTGLKPAGITHYRWSHRPLGSTLESDWRAMQAPVSRHFKIQGVIPPAYNTVQIGPDSSLPGYFFLADPDLPATAEHWEVRDYRDLASAWFDTNTLPVPGKYELKLELFKRVGTTMQRVDLTAEGVDLFEITAATPLPDSYASSPATGDRLLIDPGTGHTVGYRLVVHVDNRPCFGTINDVTLGGAAAGRCGFLEYSDGDEEALISFRASHPDNFATFDFRLVRVTTEIDHAAGLVEDSSANGYNRAGDTFSKTPSVDTLMTIGLEEGETACTRAAFAEELHVRALATNGYDRLSGLDAPRPDDDTQIDLRAFAITPA
jgi:hypothetical protein